MSWFRPYTHKCIANRAGFGVVDLLIAVTITASAVATTAGLFQGSHRFLIDQQQQIEATQNARAALDAMVRDLRLSGACLPVTGDFMCIDASTSTVNGNSEDQIWTRTGLVRPNLSCVTSATTTSTPAVGSSVVVQSVDGFGVGMRAYIRGNANTGEYFDVTSVTTGTNTLGRSVNLSTTYAIGSGVYAIDERHYFIQHQTNHKGADTPILMQQVGAQTAQAFATGIEALDFQYELNRNCTPCDVTPMPASDNEWRLVKQLYVSVTARSDSVSPMNGQFYRRTITVGVKPRNLVP